MPSKVMGGKQKKQPESKFKIRENFDSLAAFIPSLKTNSGGEVRASFQLPDNLTRYKIVCYSSTDYLYGLNTSEIKAQLAFSLRPSVPRFLNYNDDALVSLVLVNQTSKILKLKIGLETKVVQLKEGFDGGYKFLLPALKRLVVQFPIHAPHPGDATMKFVAYSSDCSDAITKSVPVYSASTTECFAAYGNLGAFEDSKEEEGKLEIAIQKVIPPSSMLEGFGGLTMSFSTTQISVLTDALVYLYSYKFECAEQLSSKILGFLPVIDVLEAFNCPQIPSRDSIEEFMEISLDRLKKKQALNGGFGFWNW